MLGCICDTAAAVGYLVVIRKNLVEEQFELCELHVHGQECHYKDFRGRKRGYFRKIAQLKKIFASIRGTKFNFIGSRKKFKSKEVFFKCNSDSTIKIIF